MMPRALRAAGCGICAACIVSVTSLTGCATAAVSRAPATPGGIAAAGAVQPTVMTPAQAAMFARARQREEELLASPLTAESAAEIALLHHPAVDRGLEALGLYELDRLQLAHNVNPAFNRGRPPDTADTRIERSLSINVMTWLIVPALAPSTPIERAPGVRAADEIAARLFTARRAWINAVAARQTVRYLEDVVVAAEVSRDLVQRMRRIGNSSELDALRAQSLYADAVAHLTAAQVAAAVERERLAQVLGLFGADVERVQLPDRLPDVPAVAVGPGGLEERAVAQRFDIQAARLDGLAAEAGVNGRSDVRTAWLGYRGAHDLARLAEEAIVPLARRVSDEQLKLYNGMLIGVLDLVADATERINAVTVALDAERDFWLAEVELERAMAGVGVPAAAMFPGMQSGFRPGTAYHVH
jgi:outer membrane protein, multidrug efflux system